MQLALIEYDVERPADFFLKKQKAPAVDKEVQKLVKKANAMVKKTKGGAVSRQLSVKWFKEIEMKKGAGVDKTTGGFTEWFHGIITRKQSEVRVLGCATYLGLTKIAVLVIRIC